MYFVKLIFESNFYRGRGNLHFMFETHKLSNLVFLNQKKITLHLMATSLLLIRHNWCLQSFIFSKAKFCGEDIKRRNQSSKTKWYLQLDGQFVLIRRIFLQLINLDNTILYISFPTFAIFFPRLKIAYKWKPLRHNKLKFP